MRVREFKFHVTKENNVRPLSLARARAKVARMCAFPVYTRRIMISPVRIYGERLLMNVIRLSVIYRPHRTAVLKFAPDCVMNNESPPPAVVAVVVRHRNGLIRILHSVG